MSVCRLALKPCEPFPDSRLDLSAGRHQLTGRPTHGCLPPLIIHKASSVMNLAAPVSLFLHLSAASRNACQLCTHFNRLPSHLQRLFFFQPSRIARPGWA